MIKTDHDRFIFKSALKPLLIAVIVNMLIVGIVFAAKKLSPEPEKIQAPLVKYDVLGETISPTPTRSAPSASITPTVPLDYKISMDGALNRYTNSKYKFTFTYPIDWSLTQKADIACGTDDTRINVCEQITIKSPSFQNFHIQFTSLENSSKVKIEIPQGKPVILNVGLVKLMGSTVYWNIISEEGKQTFLCYGKRYKLCDQFQFKLDNASLYVYGGDLVSSLNPGMTKDEIKIMHKIFESIQNKKD